MEYRFADIEAEIKQFWKQHDVYRVQENPALPKYYVLDMFPYPSGAGLHVGHPLGYIASDIVSRWKRLQGFNVLHPMGYDSFGLPAEQYAIQTGQHPAVTTEQNIQRYREQLDKIGFSYDWSREVRTSDPAYYKWTQWIFLQLFESWYDCQLQRARPIKELVKHFSLHGTDNVNAHASEHKPFTAEDWNNWTEDHRQTELLKFRLAYLADSWVNWCPALGTVLANDEVKDGLSERGGFPVEQRVMKQWSLRITAYATRLLESLNHVDFPESIKESQRNWIGKSEGAYVMYRVKDSNFWIKVFTTRPDTIFGASFLVLAPEHDLVERITTPEYREQVDAYRKRAGAKTERERSADVKNVSGQFSGAYAIHPFTGKPIPVYIADYVLATYGTGAVMAVPAGDSRDHRFAKLFALPILPIFDGIDTNIQAHEEKHGTLVNSGFLNGFEIKDAINKAVTAIEDKTIGERKINFRLRDAVFGRQRYWGEPIPIYYKNGIPYGLPENELPLVLPEIDKYLPTETGDPPLARATNWKYKGQYDYELTTMPGWAGSSWYFFRYMDPQNTERFASDKAIHYWKDVDFYLGGSEHATGHLLYFRFWTKVLYDLGLVPTDEPVRKLVNQGMIQGVSSLVPRLKGTDKFVSADILETHLRENNLSYDDVQWLYADVSLVDNGMLNMQGFREWNPEYAQVDFVTNSANAVIVKQQVEKMSKRWFNVVNPDDVVAKYGADGFRMYEMFLGPIEMSKPWDTKGIDGVARFLRKFWRLFYNENNEWIVNDDEPTKDQLKTLHRTIKKVSDDLERLSFNTAVSAFMIAVNELSQLNTRSKKILEPLLVLMHPLAPFMTEYLWLQVGHSETILKAKFPVADESLLVENAFEYPVSVNGKVRTKLVLPLELTQPDVEKEVLALDMVQKWLEGKAPKKVIFVKGRMINVVV